AAHLAVTQAVIDQREQLTGGRDAADAGAAAAGDTVEVGGLLAASREPLGGLDGGPADQPGPCLVIGPRRTVVSDSRWRGVSPAQEHSCGAPAKRWTSPISATNTAASTGPTPGMVWRARYPTSPAKASATSRCRVVISWS